jgi:hypothetical protein
MLRQRCAAVRLVLAGSGPYRPDEIATYLDVPVAALVPHDPAGAGILAGRKRQAMGWTRRPLLAAARTLAVAYRADAPLDRRIPTTAATGTAAQPAEVTP